MSDDEVKPTPKDDGDQWCVVVQAPDGTVRVITSREQWRELKARFDADVQASQKPKDDD
jgi:hypothetical protein